MSKTKQTRREFIKAGAATAIGIGLPASVLGRGGQSAPSDRIVFGLIGCGGMGGSNMRNFCTLPEPQFKAVCDVDTSRMPGDVKFIEDKFGRKPDIHSDYRKMLEDKDIDAIIVGTPDHWHALNFIHCCEAGKDVYQEKPLSHNITEAKAMLAAQNRFKIVSQVGTWQRSDPEFTNSIAYVRAGKLGRVTHCRAWIADGTRIGRKQTTAAPANLDYDAWIGPAEMVPYQDNKVHWNWRWVLNTGGGLTTDWGVHMMDIALLGMSKSQDIVMPDEVTTHGGQWAFTDDDRDAPDSIESIYRFSDPYPWTMTWSVLRDHPGKPGHCTEFVGADGRTVRCWRGGWQILDPDGKELPKEEFPKAHNGHWSNFIECVKTRQKPRATLGSVAMTTMVCHLSNASLWAGETVHWSKAKMDIVGSAGKDTMAYDREYRKPYVLPRY